MANSRINKVLIANRGEISLRIQRACSSLGIDSVAALSTVDTGSYFARQSKDSVVVGDPPAQASYLNGPKLIEAALSKRCDAIHPGYGFLSENAEFAQSVKDAGLTFIGPTPETIKLMGSKTLARERVTSFGVPCTPGSSSQSDDVLIDQAAKIGFPVIIKAVAGGGGRGMRIVNSTQEMKEVVGRARAEALKNFASSEVFIEKYIREPRHVEVQVFGDSHGNIIHLGTRDCSTQRRHQKLVEEAPAPYLSDKLREEIHQAAVNAAKSVNYLGAGTVEFLVKDDTFYFLEMNTRIQVEHPVTEEVTGLDLVQMQLLVAQGEPLPVKQEEVKFTGHAIEFRIYAEDPWHGFRPATGKIGTITRPSGDYIREEYAYEAGDQISPYYDAMLSKLIVKGATREEAIMRSRDALKNYRVDLLPTTIDFHRWLLYRSEFLKAPVDIAFIDRAFNAGSAAELKCRNQSDPHHRPAISGAECRELLTYTSTRGVNFQLELVHRKEGDFLARPLAVDGRAALPKFCRLSNGHETAVRSLIEEVLEREENATIFGQ